MDIHWITPELARQRLSPVMFAHLADDGSLTRRIRQTCRDRFAVRLIAQGIDRPDSTERELLKLDQDESALVRQVFLCCGRRPRIYARTVVGLVDNNRPLVKRLEELGQQSLGSILFRDPLANKKALHLAELPPDHDFFQGLQIGAESSSKCIWVRRSLYDYQGCELIVYEAFVDFDPEAVEQKQSEASG